jgi:hypothetical protein
LWKIFWASPLISEPSRKYEAGSFGFFFRGARRERRADLFPAKRIKTPS